MQSPASKLERGRQNKILKKRQNFSQFQKSSPRKVLWRICREKYSLLVSPVSTHSVAAVTIRFTKVKQTFAYSGVFYKNQVK